MKHSKDKKSLIISTRTGGSSNCFNSIFQRLACGGNAISPTPPDHPRRNLVLPAFKSNGCIHPNPNVVPQSEPTSSNSALLDHSGSFEAARPGLVARLMGLESMPDRPDPAFLKDSAMNLRSKSLNSLHWYIFPDTFLDHVSPAQSFSLQQRRQPSHRRTQTSSSVLCVESSPLKEKFDGENVKRRKGELSKRRKGDGENEKSTSKKSDKKGSVIGRRKALEDKVSEDHGNRRCGNRKDGSMMDKKWHDAKRREIKYTDFGTKLRSRTRNGGEWKLKVDENRTKSGPSTSANKDDSARRRRKPSRKIKMDRRGSADQAPVQCHDQERNLSGFKGEKLCTNARKETEDGLELMAQISRLTEECVRGNEWIIFDENVKGLGAVFAGELLEVLIDQFLDELLVG